MMNCDYSIETGKFSTREVIAHIMHWDKYFFEEAIEKKNQFSAVTVKQVILMNLTKVL